MSCTSPTFDITNVNRMDTNDFTTVFTLRYRLASDPDISGSYTAVTTTKNMVGVTIPFLDLSTLDPGTYVVHTYQTSSGSTTGTKITIVVGCDDIES